LLPSSHPPEGKEGGLNLGNAITETVIAIMPTSGQSQYGRLPMANNCRKSVTWQPNGEGLHYS
jgi:hypothetical protein